MQNPIDRSAQSALSMYANYAEKRLLARGEISSCFASVLQRLNRGAKFDIGYRAATFIIAVTAITWLTYRGTVDSHFTPLICFAPIFLCSLWRSTSQSKRIWQAIAKLETIAEIWREHESEANEFIHDGEPLSRNPSSLVAH